MTQGDCAPSDEAVGPPSNLKSQSTTENRKTGISQDLGYLWYINR